MRKSDSLGNSKDRQFYRSQSHPALLSLVPLSPPESSSPPISSSPPPRSRSPVTDTNNNNNKNNTGTRPISISPTNSDLPNLRFLEFEAPPSPPTAVSTALSSAIPPPPPPPPPLTSQRPTLGIKPTATYKRTFTKQAPKLQFTRNRKSPQSSLPPTIPEELSPPPATPLAETEEIGIKPRHKLDTSAVLSLESDPFAPSSYIPPPPPPPPQLQPKYTPRFSTKRGGNPNFAPPSVPVKFPSQKTSFVPVPPSHSTFVPEKGSKFQQHLFAIPPAIAAPSYPVPITSDASFSLPRTIRKSSEALIVNNNNRKRLSKSGTLPPRIAPVLIGGRPVRPTSIFGSYEPDYEPETENIGPPNLETINLHSCHELDSDSLLSIGNLIGEYIRSIDLSLCPVNDATLGEFAPTCPGLKHLAIRYH